MTRTLIGIGFKRVVVVALSVCCTLPGWANESRSIKSQERPQSEVLTDAQILFHTNDDDKDQDTVLEASLICGNQQIARIEPITNERFEDGSDKGPYSFSPLRIKYPRSRISVCALRIRIGPKGHDNWRFNATLTLTFSGGEQQTSSYDDIKLSQDNRGMSFPIK